jgi:CHAT domain-containing protein
VTAGRCGVVGVSLVAAMLAWSQAGFAQVAQLEVRGHVSGPGGQVELLLINVATRETRQVRLSLPGDFVFQGLRAGEYDIVLTTIAGVQSRTSTTRRTLEPGSVQLGDSGFAVDITAVQTGSVPPPSPPVPAPPAPAPPLPEPPTPASEPPVYNAIFDDAPQPIPVRLAPSRSSVLRFFIGPKDARNAIAGPKWTVSPEILAQEGNLDLTVMMFCAFCASQRLQSDAMTYDSRQRRSTEARFTIVTPERPTQGTIVLAVTRQGREYNNIALSVVVGDADQPPPEAGEFPWDPPPGDPDPVDLLIAADRDPNDSVNLLFVPINPILVSRLGPLTIDRTGAARRFVGGPQTASAAQATVLTIYSNLRALASPLEDALRKQLQASGTGLPALGSLDKMPADAAGALLESMVTPSRTLYNDLFLSGGDDLASVLQIIEQTDIGRPLRMAIYVGQLSIPWQLLHPPGALKADGVWGFKYEMSILPIRRRAGRVETTANAVNHLIFGLYGDRNTDEDVYTLGRLSAARFARPPVLVDSKERMIEQFSSGRADLDAFVTYTHAHSGVGIVAAGGAMVIGADPAGARIEFGPTSFVSGQDLRNLAVKILDATQIRKEFLLPRRPIVILNACETGSAATYSVARGEGLPEIFLWLGARGVVSTEGPVPMWFGYFFGRELLGEFEKGTRFASALLRVRRAMWQKNNPLGLLYGYFGSPTARGF